MTNLPVDQDARDIISRTALGETLFVEAGAGSGKTSQLVERIANLVIVADVRLAAIAAITFTEAAAAELQARIRVRFEKEIGSTSDPVVRERCVAALADADRAAISTLHGFASRILSEYAVEAGLPPQIRVLDEVSSQLAHEERWARFVDELHATAELEPLLVQASVLKIALEPAYQGHATMKDVVVELAQNWDRLEPIAAGTPPPLAPVDFAGFDSAVANMAAVLSDCTDQTDLFFGRLSALMPQLQSIVEIDDPVRKLRALTAEPNGWSRGSSGGRKGSWVDVDAARRTLVDVNAAREAVIADATDPVLRHLLVLVARHVLEAAHDRRDDGGLEFHDLLVLARELLRSSHAARSTLHDRFTHLLLDEFQDTDPIQIELAARIAATVTGDGASCESWNELAIDAGRLFFVGDPKQSIYRFRRADIALFLEARRRFAPNETWTKLLTNFRTVPPILEWVNGIFGSVMADELPGRQPAYEALHPYRAADSGADHRVVVLGGPHPDENVLAGVLRAAEATSVAEAIADIMSRPDHWPVRDGDTEPWRPARLADVTILVPTRTSVPFLRDALDEHNLPYRLATGTLVYDTQEVRDALAAVRAVDDPTDELSLVAALRSALFACSDVDLFTWRAAGGSWDHRSGRPDGIGVDHPVAQAFDYLRSLWQDRWWLTPSALLERLLRERRAALLAFGRQRPAEVWRRLRFLVDQARAFEQADGSGLRSFLQWAELQGADGARVHEPLLPETDDDAVRIMTIHGAKGLEFPITVLSGMTTAPGRPRVGLSLLWDDEGEASGDRRLALRMKKGVATDNHEPRSDLEAEMDVHEKQRLLYVAATRARDHLVVSCHHKHAGPATYARQMWEFCDANPKLIRGPKEPVQGTLLGLDLGTDLSDLSTSPAQPGEAPDVDAWHAERASWLARRGAVLAEQGRTRTISATEVARTVDDQITDSDDDGSDLDAGADADDLPAVQQRRRGRAGTAIGRAVHATLQLLDLTEPCDIDRHVRRQCDLESIPEHVPVVAAMVRSALASDAVRLAASGPHHKELYVAAPAGERVIEGYVDLLVESPDGLIVVDYKTDSVRSEADVDAKLAAYELQGASYAVALETVTGQAVVECRFVFCRPGGAIERAVADLPAAMAQVRARLASM